MGRRKKSESELMSEGDKPFIDRSTLKAPINEWVETASERYLIPDTSQCFILFDKALGMPILEKYRQFSVKKDSYSNQLPIICRYINFFIHEYDKEQELINAYLNLKFSVDNPDGDIYFSGNSDEAINAFYHYVYDVMFTDSMVKKIHQLVEDNYLDDIEQGDGSKKYVTKEKKHLESLEFTNEHIKTLLKISFGIKMLTPIIFHYYSKNGVIINKETPYLFRAYRPLFDIFSDTCNMYNKLFVYVDNRFSVH
jgi:hypothetical protein